MRVAIDGGGYATATRAFEIANQRAAMHHDALTGILDRYPAMAGDDSSAADFAATYDEAATEGVGALQDLVDALASVGRLTTAAYGNHRRAEQASVMTGAVVYDGDVPDHGYLRVLTASPPSALGGDPGSLPSELNWIVDQVHGFVWPNADIDRLRAAAGTWRSAAGHVADLTTYTDGALRGFAHEHSPEIPLATTATLDLGATIEELTQQYDALAAACDDYADHVEVQRQAILDLVWALLRDAVIVQGLGIVLGAVTVGLTAAGAAAINAARIAAEAPRFARIISTLRTLVDATVTTIRTAISALARVRDRLVKFHKSRVRDERGEINLDAFLPGWLKGHEVRGGHTVEKHVGRSDDWLRDRLRDHPNMERASSFADEDQAATVVRELLQSRKKMLDDWLASDRQSTTVSGELDRVVGRTMYRSGEAHEVRGVRVVVVRDTSMPDGFRVYTAYPTP